MNLKTIKEAVQALAESLQVDTMFPAALFVLINAHFLLPWVFSDLDVTTPSAVVLIISSILMLSYTFYAFNGPLIRFFEGYQWRNSGFFHWRERIQKNAFKKLQGYLEEQRKLHRQCIEDHKIRRSDPMAFTPEMQKRWEECEESRFDWAKAERRFDLEYPAEPDRVLPTKLGNTMVAFEDYPRTRYGIDAIALWSRLVPLLRQNEYLDFVNQEKRVLDFLLNTCVVIAVLGLETSYVALYKGTYFLWIVPIALLLSLGITWVLYQAMVFAARQWGTTIRAAFDLYRHDLYKHLGLRPSYSFKTEYERWQAISQFLLYRRENPENFGEFVPQIHLIDYNRP